MIRKFILIKHIHVINANAFSSPYTIGFPAMTAWLGVVHALERKLRTKGFEQVRFVSMGVVTHQADLQTYRGPGDYVSSIVGTANPLDKDGERPSFIEEARIHMDISLVIEVEGLSKREEKKADFTSHLKSTLLGKMKLAGGDIIHCEEITLQRLDDESRQETQRFLATLMPSYTLIERRDLMIDAMKEYEDALDALLGYVAIHHSCEKSQESTLQKLQWRSYRKTEGWIVPIAVGFHAVSDLGHVLNQRDPETPHRFAESIVTLGEFKMPFRCGHIDEMLWHYRYDEKSALYLCEQNKIKKGEE